MNLAIKGNWCTDRVRLDLWHAGSSMMKQGNAQINAGYNRCWLEMEGASM